MLIRWGVEPGCSNGLTFAEISSLRRATQKCSRVSVVHPSHMRCLDACLSAARLFTQGIPTSSACRVIGALFMPNNNNPLKNMIRSFIHSFVRSFIVLITLCDFVTLTFMSFALRPAPAKMVIGVVVGGGTRRERERREAISL